MNSYEKALGIKVTVFPDANKEAFESLPDNASAFKFQLKEQNLSGPIPKDWFETVKTVHAKSSSGEQFEAYCGKNDDNELANGREFPSTLSNRRHSYENSHGPFHPRNIFIGQQKDGKLHAKLYFRDVGSHSTHPHAFAMADKQQCHLAVCDVFVGPVTNRLKLYWALGDLSTGKWLNVWLVDNRTEFTSSSRPWLVASKKSVHLVWNWLGQGKAGGVYYLERKQNEFGKRICIFDEQCDNLDLAVDLLSGRLLVVFSCSRGVFVASKTEAGSWNKPMLLSPDLKDDYAVSAKAMGDERFIIRIAGKKNREFVLEANTNIESKK